VLGLNDRVEPAQQYVSVPGVPRRSRSSARILGRSRTAAGCDAGCADEARELTYVPIAGATRHGPRPEKLAPRGRRAMSLGDSSTEA
jgi:hypothetical protein